MRSRFLWLFILILPITLSLSCQEPVFGPDLDAVGKNLLQTPSFRQPTAAAFRLLEESPQGVLLRAEAGTFSIDARPTHGRLFSTLECKACGWTNELGRPRLPVVRQLIEAPPGAKLLVKLVAPTTQMTSLQELGAQHQIFPVQRPVEKLPGAQERTPFEMDHDLYAKDAFYPRQSYSVTGPFRMRGHWLYSLEYYPLRYNPFRAEVRTTPEAELKVDFVGGSPELKVQQRFSPAYDSWFEKRVLNYHGPQDKDISTQKYAEGILVISGDAYADNAGLLDYVETRRAEGHFVQFVAMSDVGSTDLDVRNYVISQYQAWTDPALTYVVLVGDVDDVPTHNGSGGSGGGQVTDLYYASIDPEPYTTDLLYPDLFVSRISVNNLGELGLYITRANKYVYADFPTDDSWMKRGSWLASCDNSSISEGTHLYANDNYTAPLGFTGIIPNDPEAGGDKLWCSQGDASPADITAALNDGRLFINMSGHGGETSWADPSYSDLSGVTPPDAAPFVISDACVTGSFGYSSDCWGERWLAHSHGAIMYWGSSNNSYWGEDDIMERRMWDGVFADGITRFSDLIRNAKMELLAHYSPSGTMDYYFEMYNALGDGTIDFYTDVAFDAGTSYPAQILLGTTDVTFSVTNGGSALPGALVCVQGLGVQQVGYTDSGGQVTIIMNPPPASVGDLGVTITAHNMRRHEGTIEVIPASGPYLAHESHQITSDGVTPITPNPGRHVVMPITLHNLGSAEATAISTTLLSSSTDITITQSQPTFSDIAAGASQTSGTHAEFDIHPDVTDGTVVDFQLQWSTAKASGDAFFSVTMQSPILVYVSHTVDDSAGGCDSDDIADVDEPAVFGVTIENLGSAATGAVLSLSAPNCSISGSGALGSVAAGAQATAYLTVEPLAGTACPAVDVQFDVSVDANELPAPDQSTFYEVLNADIAVANYTDDMEGTEPNGWSHSAAAGTDDWHYVTDSSHSPSHAWFSADVAVVTDDRLMTPVIAIGDTAQLVFWQNYDFESGFDGGVLEISTDGGSNYSDLGAYITQGGYTHTISSTFSSPIAGQEAWSGTQGWHEVIVDLSSFGPNDIILRFRLACDTSVAATGWWIDDVTVDAETVVCQDPPCDTVDCDDGNACTNDSWTGTECLNTPIDCSDANPCTNDTCDPATGCVNTNNTAPCDDGNACTTDDTCAAGACVSGPPANCDDGNVCTDDSCVPVTGCVNTDNTSPCNDGDACTTNDTCTAGACVGGAPLDCNDGNVCTDDRCMPATGCAYNNNTAPCDDGDACTTDDTCAAGACVSGPPANCDDGNVCTDDSCVPATGCVNTNNTAACNDGDACTTNDTCAAGACVGTAPLDCDDSNVCTDDSCVPATGCLNTNNTEPCDDGDACTTDDTCAAGACVSGPPANCDDGNVCTDDSCVPATGCVNADNTASCNDGDACTTNDSCAQGACVGGAPPDCDDGNVCTDDSCEPATGCAHADNTAPCDDGNLCTQGESCQSGVCSGGNPVQCPVQDPCQQSGTCDPASGDCDYTSHPDGTACDDGNACTQTDSCQDGLCAGADPVICPALDECHLPGECDPATALCTNPQAPDDTACDDGDGCTQTDACQAGECTGSDPLVCLAQDSCHLAGECDPADGSCSNPVAPDGEACDDEDACTQTDTCLAGVCTGSDPVTCQAQDTCHLPGECDPLDGTCSNPVAPDSTECPDGVCQDGECIEEDPDDGSANGCSCSHGQDRAPLTLFLLGVFAVLWLPRRRKQ